MPKAMILCGSADETGVTRAMCEQARTELTARGFDVSLFLLSEMRIDHCRDCNGCTSQSCYIDDDMSEIYSSFQDSDIMILSSPIHFSGPSSLLKTAMDRFQPSWYEKGAHPSISAAMLCGGSDRPNFDITISIIRAFSITTGMEFKGSLNIPGTDRGVQGIDAKVKEFVEDIISGMV